MGERHFWPENDHLRIPPLRCILDPGSNNGKEVVVKKVGIKMMRFFKVGAFRTVPATIQVNNWPTCLDLFHYHCRSSLGQVLQDMSLGAIND